MAYSQSKKLTDTEKRLQALRVQLFGKEGHEINVPITTSHKPNFAFPQDTVTIQAQYQDLTYLKKDLLKILTLAMIALGVQFILYMQFTFKVLKFN